MFRKYTVKRLDRLQRSALEYFACLFLRCRAGRRHCTPSTSQSHRQELRMCGCGQLKSQQPSCRHRGWPSGWARADRWWSRRRDGRGNYFPNRRWSRHRESHMNVSPPLRSQRRFFQSPNCRSGWVNSEGWWFRRRSGPIRSPPSRQPSRHRVSRMCVFGLM